MTKKDLADKVAQKHGCSKSLAEAVVDSVFEKIEDAVAGGERVTIAGFGVFEQQRRRAREGRNPHSGERIRIPEMVVPKFSAYGRFKGKVKRS